MRRDEKNTFLHSGYGHNDGGGVPQVRATLHMFDLEGTFHSPIIEKGFQKNSDFEHDISVVSTLFACGQLVMTYDGRGTAGVADDALAINGRSAAAM
ncbi:MAG: hypothetical protein U0939_22395 [Pirellulales bacterium]